MRRSGQVTGDHLATAERELTKWYYVDLKVFTTHVVERNELSAKIFSSYLLHADGGDLGISQSEPERENFIVTCQPATPAGKWLIQRDTLEVTRF
jgi:hypothetical protein